MQYTNVHAQTTFLSYDFFQSLLWIFVCDLIELTFLLSYHYCSWFRMCMAHQLSNNPKNAIDSCRNAIIVCQSRLDKLKSQLLTSVVGSKSSQIKSDDDSNLKPISNDDRNFLPPEFSNSESTLSEIEELKLLITDLESKVFT
jgi:hypothetical protein